MMSSIVSILDLGDMMTMMVPGDDSIDNVGSIDNDDAMTMMEKLKVKRSSIIFVLKTIIGLPRPYLKPLLTS